MPDRNHDYDVICKDCQEEVDEAEKAAENARHDAIDQILCGADFGQIVRLCSWSLGHVVSVTHNRQEAMKSIAREIMDAVDAFDEAAEDEDRSAAEAGVNPDDADDKEPAVH
jgi:hypothetical protein